MNWQERIRKTAPISLLLKIPVPWVYILAYLLGVALQLLFPPRVHPNGMIIPLKIAGAVVFAIGAFFAGWSLLIFHKARTTTTPGENPVRLITWGPYRFTRNPMYVSLLLAYLGEAGMLVQIWPVLVLPLLLAYIQGIVIPLEEEVLSRVYGKEYEVFCSRVRRWV